MESPLQSKAQVGMLFFTGEECPSPLVAVEGAGRSQSWTSWWSLFFWMVGLSTAPAERSLSQTYEVALARMQQGTALSLSLSNLAVVQADRNNWQSAVVFNIPAQPCLSPSAAAGN